MINALISSLFIVFEPPLLAAALECGPYNAIAMLSGDRVTHI